MLKIKFNNSKNSFRVVITRLSSLSQFVIITKYTIFILLSADRSRILRVFIIYFIFCKIVRIFILKGLNLNKGHSEFNKPAFNYTRTSIFTTIWLWTLNDIAITLYVIKLAILLVLKLFKIGNLISIRVRNIVTCILWGKHDI